MKIGTLKKEEMTFDKEAGEDDEGSGIPPEIFSGIIMYGHPFENNFIIWPKKTNMVLL